MAESVLAEVEELVQTHQFSQQQQQQLQTLLELTKETLKKKEVLENEKQSLGFDLFCFILFYFEKMRRFWVCMNGL